jgi:uncharacterized protein YukE
MRIGDHPTVITLSGLRHTRRRPRHQLAGGNYGEVAGMTRVLSSEEARMAITQMSNIINSGLPEQIRNLDTQGQRLSDPNVWDGKLAADFRNRWPETKRALDNVIVKLDELRNTVHSINNDIMHAGGNS